MDIGFGRNEHSSIPRSCDGKELKILDARTDPQTKLAGSMGWILVEKTKNKKQTLI
jgi:hypothetical protein